MFDKVSKVERIFYGCLFQAMRMNGFTFGWQILPDQMQVANPILILLCIPLFNKVIYPMLGQTSTNR